SKQRGPLRGWLVPAWETIRQVGTSTKGPATYPSSQAASARPERVPAIVLTCDRYHPFAAHMIMRYDTVWPSHPFTFHVPYQRSALRGPRVTSRHTREPIRATVLDLLEEFDDEAWIYWCIDDKYPVQFVEPPVAHVTDAISSDSLPGVDGVLFCRCRRL